jgi:RNA polymerase sigma-70 factor (ECF subfamily)
MRATNEETAFKAELVSFIPHMRAFARSLCRDLSEAEDIAQDALTSAWASRHRYTPGTNLRAWLFTIVRNQFYSTRRRAWRTAQLDPATAERTLMANDNPTATLELDELRRALAMLSDQQREALILVAAGGLSYEEASEICRVAVGTVKSRVSRARDKLACIYADGSFGRDDQRPSVAMSAIVEQAKAYQKLRSA